MRYHDITKDDMNNGTGLRVVLWLSGCSHECKGCQNPLTWDPNGGLLFDADAEEELFEALKKDYIDGITLSGGDPLYPDNRKDVEELLIKIKTSLPEKTVWLYTGYEYEAICDLSLMNYVDVLVDGLYVEASRDIALEWVGSNNQRIIDVRKSKKGNVITL